MTWTPEDQAHYDAMRAADERDVEWRMRLADGVLRALPDVPPAALALLARALELTGGPLARFALAISYEATARADGADDSALPRIKLAYDLRHAAWFDDPEGREDESVLAVLDGVDEQPWRALREALIAVREADKETP